MVAPFPSSEEENANLYMYKASVVDATPGPPQVVICLLYTSLPVRNVGPEIFSITGNPHCKFENLV